YVICEQPCAYPFSSGCLLGQQNQLLGHDGSAITGDSGQQVVRHGNLGNIRLNVPELVCVCESVCVCLCVWVFCLSVCLCLHVWVFCLSVCLCLFVCISAEALVVYRVVCVS